MEFSRQEYCTGSPFPSPGDLPDSGIKPRSPPLQTDYLWSEPPGMPFEFLQKVKVKSLRRVWLCGPMDCSLPGSSIHGIFQARILDWVAISFSRGSSQPRVSRIVGRRFTLWATREVLQTQWNRSSSNFQRTNMLTSTFYWYNITICQLVVSEKEDKIKGEKKEKMISLVLSARFLMSYNKRKRKVKELVTQSLTWWTLRPDGQ